jgi:chemotaxis protein CheD
MQQIVVGVGECAVASGRGQSLATFALGSCIGVAVYDAAVHVGGLLHFMLPDSSIEPCKGRSRPFLFADTAIPMLLRTVCRRGAAVGRLVAHAAGGARMIEGDRIFDVGRRNSEALRIQLEGAGVSLRRSEIGGTVSRNMRLEIGTGKIWLWEGGRSPYVGTENSSSHRR